MEDAFIGRQAVALRMEKLEGELRTTETEMAGWKPVAAELAKHKGRDSLFSRYFVHDTVEQRRTDYQRGLEITKEMKQLEEELSHLDLFCLEEQRRQINILEQEIKTLDQRKIQYNSEKTQMEIRIHTLEYEILPGLYQELTEKEDTLSERFSTSFIETVGRPRYQQEFARLKRASAVAKNFGDRLLQTENERSTSQDRDTLVTFVERIEIRPKLYEDGSRRILTRATLGHQVTVTYQAGLYI